MAQIRGSGCAHTTALRGRSTTERGVNAPLVKVDGKSVQLALQVQTIPEEDLIQKLAPHSPDKPLDEGVRARHKGDGLVFLDLQDPEVRPPAMGS